MPQFTATLEQTIKIRIDVEVEADDEDAAWDVARDACQSGEFDSKFVQALDDSEFDEPEVEVYDVGPVRAS